MELAFLCGFVLALPPALVGRWTLQRPGWSHRFLELGSCFVSMWMFYAGGVLVLSLRSFTPHLVP